MWIAAKTSPGWVTAVFLNGSWYVDRNRNGGFDGAAAGDQIFAFGQAGDILIGLSTSGNSGNIIKAFEVARVKNMITVGFTGATGGKMKPISDHLINIPSTDTPRIQESHILAGHIICQLVEEKYFA
jgi:D-sedoheptulose 7-phosphate isomerase